MNFSNQSKLAAHDRSQAYQNAYNKLTPEEKATLNKQRYNEMLAKGNNFSGLSASARAVSSAPSSPRAPGNVRNAVKIRWSPKTRKASRKNRKASRKNRKASRKSRKAY